MLSPHDGQHPLLAIRHGQVTSVLREGNELNIRLEKVSEAGNNCLVKMYFDDVLVTPAGPMLMSPNEYLAFKSALLCAEERDEIVFEEA